MTEDDLLINFPFDTTAELTEWILNYLPGKVVKYNELEDFFTIVNGGDTPEIYKAELDGDFETLLDIAVKLSYTKFKLILVGDVEKKTTFIIDKVEVL